MRKWEENLNIIRDKIRGMNFTGYEGISQRKNIMFILTIKKKRFEQTRKRNEAFKF